MPQVNPLPERLQYLQPFRKKFASRPNDLNEDTGYAPLLELLKKRVAENSDESGEKLLAEDFAQLQKWLAEPEQINDPLHFVAGVVLVASPGDLIKQIKEEAKEQENPLPWVEMDLWPRVKPRRFEKERDGGMLVKWQGLWFTVGVADPDKALKNGRPLHFWDLKNEVTSVPVQFGEVTGVKYVQIAHQNGVRSEKEIIYVLAVPGGHVEISITFIGKKVNPRWDEAKLEKWRQEQAKLDPLNWDEKPIESLFHTLRIVLKKPTG